MTLEYREYITRQMLKAEPNTLFVFGDNMQRRGFGGQAKQMRGEPNAVGIPTKLAPSMSPSAFFCDDHYEAWQRESNKDIQRLLNHSGKIIWPSNGIGTGLARLGETAPRIFAAIENIKARLEQRNLS